MKNLLPIGSVILLNESTKRLMIFGRHIKEAATGDIWDYVGCYYPEGNVGPDKNFLFNHDQIQRIYSIGFQDEEEFLFKEAYEKVKKENGNQI